MKNLLKPISLLGLIGILLALPSRALAHPLDQYQQLAYITLSATQIEVELDLSPGVLVAPNLLPLIDTDGDKSISDAEGRAYAQSVLNDVYLQHDGQPQNLTITKLETPTYTLIQAGYGTFRIFAEVALPDNLQGTHHVTFTNYHQPATAAYQVNAFVAKGASIDLGKQNRDARQQFLEMDYTLAASGTTNSSTSTTSNSEAATTLATTEQAKQLIGVLYEPDMSFWVLLGALALALLLGGLHALTPGHGKTLVAAYLVGSRGTVKHAVALGGIVTFTHTSSVIAIGLIALFASQFVVPNVLVPTLEIASGLLVVYMGARLAWTRLRSFRAGDQAHDHAHSQDHTHPHDHGHTHPHTHDHLPESVKRRDLVAMGISGGLIPCPEALGVMLIAISLNRIALGLGMIVAFSLGLALVLIALGIMLVRARSFVTRMGRIGTPVQRYLPIASALIVTLLGAGILLQGLIAYL